MAVSLKPPGRPRGRQAQTEGRDGLERYRPAGNSLFRTAEHVSRHANRAGLVDEGARDGLADPPCGICAELEALRCSNLSTARIKQILPSWIRSNSGSRLVRYYLATDTSKRRFDQLCSGALGRVLGVLHGTLRILGADGWHASGSRSMRMDASAIASPASSTDRPTLAALGCTRHDIQRNNPAKRRGERSDATTPGPSGGQMASASDW
jgi:hypothetical protein